MDADRETQQTDIHASTAQQELFNTQPTIRFVLDHHAQVNTKLLLVLMRSTVEDVILANGHNTCQMHQELNALLDH